MVKVLDACALMTYLEKGPGYEKIKALFIKAADSGKSLLMTTVNWGEVYYVLARNDGCDEAERVQHIVETFPIEFVDVDIALTKKAAIYKAEKKLPYVDCFAAALTSLHRGELITSDKDFKVLENEVKITWI